MPTTADRVRELIGDAGQTQAAFADSLGMDATKLSKSLTGVRRFSSLDLALIAENCQVSVDWLLTGEEPALATAARRSAGTSASTAFDLAHYYTALRDDLVGLGYRQQWSLPAPMSRRGRWVDQGAKLAEIALAGLSAPDDEPVDDLVGAIEGGFGVDVAIQPLGEQFDGLAVATPNSRLILANVTPVYSRQRFTIAHELGHLLVGDDQQIHQDEDIDSATSKHGESEMRANAFAAAFLMPEDAMLRAFAQVAGEASPAFGEADFCRVATAWHVSPSALAYRLKSLRVIDAGLCEAWRHISSAEAARRANLSSEYAGRQAASVTRRPPGSLLRDTLAAYQEGDITLRPYAQLLGVDTRQLRQEMAVSEAPSQA